VSHVTKASTKARILVAVLRQLKVRDIIHTTMIRGISLTVHDLALILGSLPSHAYLAQPSTGNAPSIVYRVPSMMSMSAQYLVVNHFFFGFGVGGNSIYWSHTD